MLKLNQKGMGLAEVMVAVGITSVSMMGIISSQKLLVTGQRSNVQIEEADNVAMAISNLLTEPATCDRNFGDAPGSPGPLTLSDTDLTRDIVDNIGALIFDVANPAALYGNQKVTVLSYRLINMGVIGPTATPGETQYGGRLLVTVGRSGEGMGGNIARSITMRVTMNAANQIVSCHSMGINRSPWAIDGNNIYNTNPGNVGIGTPAPAAGFHTGAGVSVLMQDSVGMGAMPVPGTALTLGGNMTHTGDTNHTGNYNLTGNLNAGSIATPSLSVTNLTVSGTATMNGPTALNGATTATTIAATGPITAPQFCIGANCRTTFATQTCPSGQVVIQQNVDGSVVCDTPGNLIGNTVDCSVGYYLAGLNAGGGPECRPLPTGTCPVGSYIYDISAAGTIQCRPVPPDVQVANCPAGQYLIGVSGGVPQCVPNPTNSFSCPAGQAVVSFNASGSPVCGITTAGISCPAGQAMQGFDGAGSPICLTSTGTGSTSMMSMASIMGRTTRPNAGVTALALGDAPATADAFIINFVIGTMGYGSRSDRNCYITSTSGTYIPVWMGNDSRGDGGQFGVAGSVMVPTDACGSLQLNCRNSGGNGSVAIIGVVDDGSANACVRVWSVQACGYTYPVGDPCVYMPACTSEVPGGACATIGASCSRGTDQLVCVRG